jgi:hypothetical protein
VNSPNRVGPIGSLDDLELELRKLPGVRAAGFEERDGVLLVQLHVTGVPDEVQHQVRLSALRITARHADRPVAVEVVRSPEPTPTTPPAGS